MRRDIILGVGLLAVPIIAIAQSAPTPPDEPARTMPRDNPAEAANGADEPLANAADGHDPSPEPEAPQT